LSEEKRSFLRETGLGEKKERASWWSYDLVGRRRRIIKSQGKRCAIDVGKQIHRGKLLNQRSEQKLEKPPEKERKRGANHLLDGRSSEGKRERERCDGERKNQLLGKDLRSKRSTLYEWGTKGKDNAIVPKKENVYENGGERGENEIKSEERG